MRAQEEIDKLKLANSIINRGTRKLGVRPLNIGAFENPYKERRVVKRDFAIKPNINELAAKLKREQELNEKLKKPAKFQAAFYSMLAVVLVFSMIFIFNPADIIASFDKNAKPNPVQLSSTSIKSGIGRDLVICTGVFKSVTEANKYKKSLSERLGVPLTVLKDGSSYTLQIGPSYRSHEDALIVFDELSRYSVGNLSLRFAS